MDLNDLKKVWDVKPLKKIGQDEARKILEKLAKQVQPIMRKHNWRVKLLSEFCPSNRSLLGLNVGGGIEIKLRLRMLNREWDFIPYEQVLDTLLHELCHNEHGPHNASFYKLWDEIRTECENLISSRTTGASGGFDDVRGRFLGGVSPRPPFLSPRQAALCAAEKRRKKQTLHPSGPRCVGGNFSIMVALSPVQAAAMAAERRLLDEVWCASGLWDESSSEETVSDKLGHAGLKMSSDKLTVTTVPETNNVVEAKQSSVSTYVAGVSLLSDGMEDTEDKETWECNVCTLSNQHPARVCGACGTPKPEGRLKRRKVWSCKFCTLENSTTLDRCTACENWRYSCGQPVATCAPNRGT